MRQCFLLLLRRTKALAVIRQASVALSDPAPVTGFYSSFEYDNDQKTFDIPYMTVPLLPFQKEGITWMAQREILHVGGIMADHLGMGKTIQMMGLCLVSDSVQRMLASKHKKERVLVADGNRLLTVIMQMQRISVVANCSRINQPGKSLSTLLPQVEAIMTSKHGNYHEIRSEVDKWLAFTAKFHPSYEKRATAFLNDEEQRSFDLIDSKELRTLVVVPASLMLQWKSEIEGKIDPGRKTTVYLYHGDSKWVSSMELETYDFVITTYDTLSNSSQEGFIPVDRSTYAFNRKLAGPLFHIMWKRIILDEAHMIRHSGTQRWRAVQELQGLHRWAVTATPLHNSINDIQNLLQFAGLPRLPVLPGSNPEDLLKDPLLQRSIAKSLQPAFLRRGPVMVRNGALEVLVQLPSKTEVVVKQSFTPKESKEYNSILARSRSALASSERKDGAFHIFAMMTRLRQACCHPWISQGRALKVSICGICGNEAVSAVTPKCGHTFCQECLLVRFREAVDGDDVATRLPCPTCGDTIPYNTTFKKRTLSSTERIAQYKQQPFILSSKLKMILKAIQDMQENYPDDKMIIFSQFTSFMDVIAVALERYGIPFLRLDGTMPLSARNTTISHFQSNLSIKIILASKTATGIGLNLTAANHVLVVDPWWNPAVEEQAIHRCYRIGQKKPVFVSRFIIADSIEQYCFEICQRKKEFGDAVLKAATSGETGARAAASKLHELVSRLKYVGAQDKSVKIDRAGKVADASAKQKD